MILNPPIISGSLTVTGNIIASGSITLSGSVASASYAASASNASAAQTASYVLTAQTASFVALAQTASFVALAQSASNAVSAQTASFANSFTVNGTLTAQTLVVQTITSSVDFVTGSTRFGSLLANTHVFTGSVSITGSLAVITTGTEFQVTSTGVNFGNVIGDTHNITGSVGISGSLTGTSAVFAGNVTIRPSSGYNAYFQVNSTTFRTNYLNDALTANISAAYRATDFEWQNSLGQSSMNLTSAGNVGIGVTPSAWASGWIALQVGTVSLHNVGSFSQIANNIYYDGTNYRYINTSGATRIGMNTDGEFFIGTAASGTAGAVATMVTRFSINGSSGAATFLNTLQVTSATTDSSLIQHWGYNNAPTQYNLKLNTVVSSGLVKYSFDLRNNNSDYSNNLVLTNGNVGIGTNSPISLLSISKTLSATTTYLTLDNKTNTKYNWGINWAVNDSSTIPVAAIRAIYPADNDISLAFYTYNGSGDVTERVRIANDGQTRFQSSIILTNGQINSLTSVGGTQPMYLNFIGNGAIYAGSSYAVLYAGSDERIKSDIEDANPTLNKILSLTPRTFKYKERPEFTNYGFIAQEVEEIMPELVKTADGITMCDGEEIVNQKSIESYGLAWASILVKAIQELKAQNDDLQSQINELKAQ